MNGYFSYYYLSNYYYIILVLPMVIFSMIASARVNSSFKKYSKVMSGRRITGAQAAFEVLAIIAYNQPVTKAFVEQIRGVDCSGVISSLCQKSLIEEKGRLDLPGRPLIYGTTAEFLRCFCISSLDELPPLPENKVEETISSEENENSEDSKVNFSEIQ